jgi:hypothetical protein
MICSALGRIGDAKTLPAIIKVCDDLSSSVPTRSEFGACNNLFGAYHGMALLGHKKEALAELKRVYEKYGSEMKPYLKAEYRRRLEEAAKW